MAESPEELLASLLPGSGFSPLALAESCTGGLVSARVTSVPGSSGWFDRGYVVYSNRAKTELLGVPEDILARHGAVSRETALALVEGIFRHSPAGLAGAVTGIAGPDGGTPEKPVGTVWIAWGSQTERFSELLDLSGDRRAVREASAESLLNRLCAFLTERRRG